MKATTTLIPIAGLAVALSAGLAPAQDNSELKQLRTENAQLKQTIDQLQAERDQLRARVARIEQMYQQLSGQTEDAQAANERNDGLRDYIMDLKTEVAEVEQRNQELERQTKKLADENKSLKADTEKLEQVAGITATGELVKAVRGLISHEYDPDADQTIVWSKPEQLEVLRGSSAGFAVSLRMTYPGKQQRGQPESITLRLYTGETVGTLKEPEELTLRFDQGSVTLPVRDARVNRRRGVNARTRITRTSMEADAAVTPAQLQNIARHSEAVLAFDRVKLQLRPQEIAIFRAMLERAHTMR